MSSKKNEKIEKEEKKEVINSEKEEIIDTVDTLETPKENEEEQNKKTSKETKNEKDDNKKITKEEYTENVIKTSKKRIYIVFNLAVLIILVLFISIIFAVINIKSDTIINGVYVGNVDLSGLSIAEAKNKLEEAIKVETEEKLNLNNNGEKILSIKPSEIEFKYDTSEQLKQAYQIGRNDNIFINNYKIIFAGLIGKKIDLSYTYNEAKLEEILNSLDGIVKGLVENPSYYKEENNLIIVSGKDGLSIEKEKLKQIILDEIKNREYQKIIDGSYNNNIEIPTVETKAESIDIEKIYSEIYSQPKNAYYVEEPFELFLDEDGVDFAITIEEAKKLIEVPAEEYTIPLKLTKADITINDIDSSAFRYQVSTFTTNYDPGYTSRVNNLQLAASKINGKVLRPGEIFSFNEVVGKRTVEAGYTDAPIFVNGEVTDGTGGGICQISSTLYNAVVLANLKVVDRRNHNYTTSYLKAGRDATVVYGAVDFKFQNTRKYPIKIEASVSGGVARFSIYGIKEEQEYTVKIIPVVTETIPKTTQYVDDATLAEGSEVVKQVGSSGYKVTTYKELYLNGAFVSKEVLSNDTYKAMARIVRRGTKKLSVPTVSTPVQEPETSEQVPAESQTPVQDNTDVSNTTN